MLTKYIYTINARNKISRISLLYGAAWIKHIQKAASWVSWSRRWIHLEAFHDFLKTWKCRESVLIYNNHSSVRSSWYSSKDKEHFLHIVTFILEWINLCYIASLNDLRIWYRILQGHKAHLMNVWSPCTCGVCSNTYRLSGVLLPLVAECASSFLNLNPLCNENSQARNQLKFNGK